MKARRTKRLFLLAVLVVVIIACAAAGYLLLMNQSLSTPRSDDQARKSTTEKPKLEEPTEAYRGIEQRVANAFTLKVPNGWKASISDTGNFQAIMFARPEQLSSLMYDADAQPAVDRNGIPVWDGLTEHFFIRFVQPAQAFNPSIHPGVTSEPFTFDDGTVGSKYYVVKQGAEAQRYGGLLRDNEWQGRTYIYEKAGKRIEAHLALYPSSTIDKDLFEDVARSIKAI